MLIRGLIYAMNNDQFFVGAVVARTLFETVAMLRSYNNELTGIALGAHSPDAFSQEI